MGKIGNVRWVLIFWTFLIAAVSYLDRANISIAASAIQASFGIDNVRLGTVFSAFGLGYAFSQPFAGRIADRFGPRRVVFFGAIWWSVFTALVALIPATWAWSFSTLLLVRLMLGIGEAVIFPASSRLVAAWIPTQERGLANGIIFAGVGVGAGIAPPLVTRIMLASGWHLAFYVSAVIGLVAGIGWLIAVRDRPDRHPHIGAPELAHIAAGLPAPGTGEERPLPWRRILRDRQVALLSASYFTFGYVAYIFFTWFFKYLSSVRGLDLKSSGLYAALPFIGMSLGSWLGGFIGDRLTRTRGKRLGRCIVPAIAMFCAAAFVAVATQADDARVAAVVMAGGAFSLYCSSSSFWALAADIGGRSAGSVSGVMNMASQIGGVITAFLTALLADRFGWTASFLIAASLSLMGGVLWLFVDPHHRLEEVEAAA